MNKVRYILNECLYENMTAEEMYNIVIENINDEVEFHDDYVKFVAIALEKDPETEEELREVSATTLAESLLHTDAFYPEN